MSVFQKKKIKSQTNTDYYIINVYFFNYFLTTNTSPSQLLILGTADFFKRFLGTTDS